MTTIVYSIFFTIGFVTKYAIKLLYVIQGVKSIFDKVASWPHLISKLLVAPACLHVASDWPHTFFTPKVFLFSISITYCIIKCGSTK